MSFSATMFSPPPDVVLADLVSPRMKVQLKGFRATARTQEITDKTCTTLMGQMHSFDVCAVPTWGTIFPSDFYGSHFDSKVADALLKAHEAAGDITELRHSVHGLPPAASLWTTHLVTTHPERS